MTVAPPCDYSGSRHYFGGYPSSVTSTRAANLVTRSTPSKMPPKLMPELSPKQKRPTRSCRTPSPTPSGSATDIITVQQLAKSQLETQKQLTALTQSFDKRMKAFTKLVSGSSTRKHSEVSSEDGITQQQTEHSDEDYPPPA